MKFKEKRRHVIGQNRGRMFILDGLFSLLICIIYDVIVCIYVEESY
jgi:hypothetical protein